MQVEAALRSKREAITAEQASLEALQKQLQDLTQSRDRARADCEERERQLQSSAPQHDALLQQRLATQEQRKQSWRRADELQEQRKEWERKMEHAERSLRATAGRGVLDAVAAVHRIAADRNIAGVHGPLIDLIDVPRARSRVAVEVTAGQSLFHVVVDTDETAAQLIRHLAAENAGRVTFLPLNRLRVRDRQYPDRREDAVPLVSELEYDARYELAVQHVFGKTLFCRSKEVAAAFAREYDLNCVTKNGEQVNRRGALQGGFFDERRSRLEAHRTLSEARAALDDMRAELDKATAAAQESDQRATQLMGEMQRMEAQRAQMREVVARLRLDAQRTQGSIQHRTTEMEKREVTLETLRSGLRDLEAQLESLRAELGSALSDTLAAGEQEELEALAARVPEQRQQVPPPPPHSPIASPPRRRGSRCAVCQPVRPAGERPHGASAAGAAAAHKPAAADRGH